MSDSIINIPNEAGWPTQTLERMCSTISRGTAPVYVEHSNVLAIGQRCVTALGFDPAFARPHSSRAMGNVLTPEVGDVLLNSTGTGTIGRSCVFDSSKDFIVDGHVTLLRSSPGQFRGEWLDAVLRSSWAQNHLERFCYAGSTNQVELSRTELAATSLPVPSIDEQDDFVRIFRTLDHAIRRTEAIVEKLKQVKRGLLHDLLTRGLDANGELRPSYEHSPNLYQDSLVGWIPKEWEATQLGAVTAWASGGTPSRAIPSNWTGPVPLLTPKDMKSFEMSDTSERISLNAAKLGSRVMPAETVFIVVRGMILAHSFPVVLASKPMAFNQDVKAVTAGQRLSGRFLAHWFVANSGQFLRKVTEATHGTKKLDMDNLVGMPIGLPPLTEQAAIVEREAALDRQGKDESSYLLQLLALKAGITDDLLTGRVRVTPLLAQ